MSTSSDSDGGPAHLAQAADSLPAELRLTSRMGIPLAFGEMCWMSTYIVDALMIGRLPHSALSIAASSLGNTIFYTVAFLAIGLFTGLQTLTAQAYGRGNERDCTRSLVQSLWFAVVLIPLVMLVTVGFIPLLPYFGTPPDIIAETRRYLYALVWSTAPLLVYWILRWYLQSLDRVVMVTISLASSGLVNWVGDWAFLYGHLGLHRFGIAGSGWATCIVRLFAMGLLLLAVPRRTWRTAREDSKTTVRPDPERLRTLLRIGWPAALETLTSLGLSMFMSIVCARLGATLLAAHQVVLDLDAFVFMAPLGLSYATAVRVGQSAGRKSVAQARRAAWASLLLGLGYIAIASSLFVGLARFWAGLYTNDPAVVMAAVPIFLLCGLLQVGDAAGIILTAALVGVGETRSPLVVNMVWTWVLGMPLGYWLTFHDGMGLRGLWIGRVLAAVGSAVTLVLLWQWRLRSRDLAVFAQGGGAYLLPAAQQG